LEVSSSQAYSIPPDDRVDPLLGKRVVVTHGPHRGYDGYVRDVGNESVVVELTALIASSTSSPRQNFVRDHLRLM
jgi:transcription elongation factor